MVRLVGIGGQPQRAVDRHAQWIAHHDVGGQPLPEQLAEQRHVGETTDHHQRRAPAARIAASPSSHQASAARSRTSRAVSSPAAAAASTSGTKAPVPLAVCRVRGSRARSPYRSSAARVRPVCGPRGLAGAEHPPQRLAADPGAAAVVTEPGAPPVHGRTPSARVDTERHRPGAHREHGPGRPAEGTGVRDHHVGGDRHPAPGERPGEQPGEAIRLLRRRHRPGRADAHRGGGVARRRGDHAAYRVQGQLDPTRIGEPGGTRALRRGAV